MGRRIGTLVVAGAILVMAAACNPYSGAEIYQYPVKNGDRLDDIAEAEGLTTAKEKRAFKENAELLNQGLYYAKNSRPRVDSQGRVIAGTWIYLPDANGDGYINGQPVSEMKK